MGEAAGALAKSQLERLAKREAVTALEPGAKLLFETEGKGFGPEVWGQQDKTANNCTKNRTLQFVRECRFARIEKTNNGAYQGCNKNDPPVRVMCHAEHSSRLIHARLPAQRVPSSPFEATRSVPRC